ncbi:unnamed protein product [Cuscuta campestris]|uniref:Retrotransposon gag domain-containing protein n=1 Tax=Cuscuta campestris TaxID=132261 RepID=A0A484NDT1_9ASTE|nr:unnamed protein product [Cuscuta campestris]
MAEVSSVSSDNTNTLKSPHLAFRTISNIKLHIPVQLSISEPNYKKWSRLFRLLVLRFNLLGYLEGTLVAKSADDAEWYQFDALLQGWILSTISDEVSDLVLANSPTASALWKAIYKLFHDNKHARAMQLEHRFRTTVKGTKTINEYCHTLKNLADYLDDVDAPVTEHALVLQVLQGLPHDLRGQVHFLQYQNPLPSFLEVRSALLLVEQQQADALSNAGPSTALLSFSGGGGSPSAGGGPSRQGSSGQSSGRGSFGSSNRGNSSGYRGRGRGRGRSGPNQRQPGSPNPWQSVPPFTIMIVSDSDSASPSSNSRQANHSASGHDQRQANSPQPSPAAAPGQKLRQLRKQFPSSTPALNGNRVRLDENIMALCHCQITDRGFADATDNVGPSIEVLRPTRTQTALDAPSGFFTVHLASLKKGLRFPLHSLLIEFLNEVDLLPCQLVSNSHRYIAGYLIKCKEVGVKPTLDHFLFTFKMAEGHGDLASYANLSERSRKLFTSDKKGSTKDWKPFFGFVLMGPESPFTGSGLPSFRRIPCPQSNTTLLSITRKLCGPRAVEIKKVVTEESLAALGFEFVQDEHRHQPDLLRDFPGGNADCGPFVEQEGLEEEMEGDLLIGHFIAGRKRKRDAARGRPWSPAQDRARISAGSDDDLNNMVLLKLIQATLGMIELVGQRQDRQAAMDEAKRAVEDKQRELQDEVARLVRELEEEKGRFAQLEVENASLSFQVGSISARVAELEGEKVDLIQQLEAERSDQARRLEEAVESFKSSPEFTIVAKERMGKLVVEWVKTGPGAEWMVGESDKTFNCGLFRAQLVFCDKLARLAKGISLSDLGLPPPCCAFTDFDPSAYLDEESSSASDEEEESTAQGD